MDYKFDPFHPASRHPSSHRVASPSKHTSCFRFRGTHDDGGGGEDARGASTERTARAGGPCGGATPAHAGRRDDVPRPEPVRARDGSTRTDSKGSRNEKNRRVEVEHRANRSLGIAWRVLRTLLRRLTEATRVDAYSWWRQWQRYVAHDEYATPSSSPSIAMATSPTPSSPMGGRRVKPGPIDNLPLLEGKDGLGDGAENGGERAEALHLRSNLQEQYDYVIVHESVWEALLRWYGGGPTIAREVVLKGVQRVPTVEIYPLKLLVVRTGESKNVVEVEFSSEATVGHVKAQLCKSFGLEVDKVRMWDYYHGSKYALLDQADRTLESARIMNEQKILLEVKTNGQLEDVEEENGDVLATSGDSTGDWIGSYNGGFKYGAFGGVSDDTVIESAGQRGGLCGLSNLGNTCFMNSALQCLSHTESLVHYFTSKQYHAEINKDNPLGMGGELAKAFGALMEKLWRGGASSISPRNFKHKMARCAPQFSGYQQHDSQEFVAFLLDGLHEDLNRVKQKPYMEEKEDDGRPEEVIADEQWGYYCSRNDSIIVENFQGQYKSTLICPMCGKHSLKFDPFMYLSLPLPSTKRVSIKVTVISTKGEAPPTKYCTQVPKQGSIDTLLVELGNLCELEEDEALLLTEIYGGRIFKYFDDHSEALTAIKPNDTLVAYRLPADKVDRAGKEYREAVIFHRRSERRKSYLSSERYEKSLFAAPLLVPLHPSSEDLKDELRHVEAGIEMALKPFVLPAEGAQYANGDENGADMEETSESSAKLYRSEPAYRICRTNQNGTTTEDFEMAERSSGDVLRTIGGFFVGKSYPGIEYFALDWSTNAEEKYDLGLLEAPRLHSSMEEAIGAERDGKKPVTLQSCMECFLDEEKLDKDDMWYCPKCKVHRQATKKLDLWRLPDVLVVHLKRFSFSRLWREKLDTTVEFPHDGLDLSSFLKANAGKEKYVYDLYGVSNHYGSTGGGHYTAFAKLPSSGQWYHFDDSRVSPVDVEDVKTQAAYLLFYQRRHSEGTEISAMDLDEEKLSNGG